MISSIFKFVSLARQALRGGASPASLAAGVTAGFLAGIIPNDSLVVPVIVMVVMATSTNLFAAAMSMILFSWLGHSLDSVLHQTGALVLTHPSLQSILTWAADAPILPWTRFNNTVVCGAMVLGAGLAYPVYFGTYQLAERFAPIIHRRLIAYRLFRAIAGIPTPATPAVTADSAAQPLTAQPSEPDLGATT